MNTRALLLLALLAAACDRESGASEGAAPVTDFAAETCVGCHERINPGLVRDHDAGPHARAGLGCETCHGTDHEEMFSSGGAVSARTCGTCHAAAYELFQRSRHGRRLREGKLDPLLDPLRPETGGCTAAGGCHSIQKPYADGSVGRCGGCHITHAFRNEEARDPRVCTGCHGGPDHPQYEAWLRSAHSLPSPAGAGPVAGCVACHEPHDVSEGVVHGLPPVRDPSPVATVPPAGPEEFARARGAMVERCKACHTTRIARAALETADLWRHRGAAMLDEAAAIVKRLHRDGLLDPAPEGRVANPVAGHALRLGGAQIFDGAVSLPERLYYEMYFQHYPALWRAAYHNDPERLAWHGNDALKSALDRLRAEERLLRGGGPREGGNQ